MVKVVFTAKEHWGKKDCLFCGKTATLQANAEEGNDSASIRCCEKDDCKKKAEQMAREYIEKVLSRVVGG